MPRETDIARKARSRRKLAACIGWILALALVFLGDAMAGQRDTFGVGQFSRDAPPQVVHFNAPSRVPSPFKRRIAAQKGIELREEPGTPLWGRLSKPPGEGPFPAVVLLHGWSGMWQWNDVWAARLADWGYVVLGVDSRGPRGLTYGSGPRYVGASVRAEDAHGAKAYLASQPFVDPGRIAVLGMSQGGLGALLAVADTPHIELAFEPFRAAVAFYPRCFELARLHSPLLVMIGDKDGVTPASNCQKYVPQAESAHEVVLKVYPGAHHVFDHEGLDGMHYGKVVRYDAAAAADAIERVRRFLARNLR